MRHLIIIGVFCATALGNVGAHAQRGILDGYTVSRDPISGDTVIRGGRPGQDWTVRRDPISRNSTQIIGPGPADRKICRPSLLHPGQVDCN